MRWSHGFLLRRASGGNYYRLSIDNSSDWMYFHRLGGGPFLGQQRSHTDDIDTSPGGQNLLQVVMRDDRAWVYINGAYQGYFSMTADTLGDWIRLFVSDRRAGTTEFTDFAVWKLDPSMYRDFPELNPGYIPPPMPTPTITPTPNPAIPYPCLALRTALSSTSRMMGTWRNSEAQPWRVT